MAAEPDSPIDYVHLLMTGGVGVVHTPELAVKLAEALIAGHFGDEQLACQRPMTVADQGDHWMVRGSYNRDHKVGGKAETVVKIRKSDGRVADLHMNGVVHPYGGDTDGSSTAPRS